MRHPVSDLQLVSDLGARRRLRSSSTSALVAPRTVRATIGNRAFPAAAASVLFWCCVIISVAVLQSQLDEYKKHNLHSGYNNRLFSQHAAHIQYNALNNIQRYDE